MFCTELRLNKTSQQSTNQPTNQPTRATASQPSYSVVSQPTTVNNKPLVQQLQKIIQKTKIKKKN